MVCASVHACVCVHIPNMWHVVWYRAQDDTFLEKLQTISVGSACSLRKAMRKRKY